jgi:hypothetical protein
MKTLFLLLLVSGMAWGQLELGGTIIDSIPRVIDPYMSKPYEFPTQYANPFDYHDSESPFLTLSDLVSLWQEYKDSCWADSVSEMVRCRHDSTLDRSAKCWWVSIGGPTFCDQPAHNQKRVWLHGTKPTFPGFMEFLTRRTK